jgi:hypothetical protein
MEKWKFGRTFFMTACLGLSLALVGCSGDDGSTGPQGPQGEQGEQGEQGDQGTDTTVNVQTLADLGLVFSGDVDAINPTLDLSQTVSYDAATGAVTVHFFLTDEDDSGIDVTSIPYEMRVYVSELIPGVADDSEDPGAAWNQLIAERGTPAVAGSEMPGTLELVDAATGEYNYTLATTIASTNTNPIRVTVRARFRFRDNNNQYVVVANPINASYDFLLADAGTRLDPATTDLAELVTTAACEACHGDRIGNVGHGGGYTQVKTCNHCHNLNYMATRTLEGDLAFMIHRIHNAGAFDELDDAIDFSEVTYPQPTSNCATCHDGAQAAQAYTTITRRNCDSCHNIDFTTAGNPDSHSGGVQASDASCLFCHGEGGLGQGPIEAHAVAPAAADTPEFDVTIAMTAPGNGTHYIAGETPVVTVTLADHATGDPVAGTVYTADQDGEAALDVGEGLSLASLYVYGPRNEAVPVLTTNSTTDGGKQQAHSLLLTGGVSADLQVMTDANGYKYQLMDNIGDLEPGTYMVRFEGADYGAVTNDDYVTSSSAFITFQVGTDTEEAKVAGDACLDCHGDTIMHLSGAHPHNVPFDTDACLGCHDKSGNYGDYIGNRVHAVHKASALGDTHDRDWSEVTFPRPANNCTTCHTNEDAETPVWETPDMLACGGCHGVHDDPTDLPAGIVAADHQGEIGAAQHMVQNGGSIDPTVTPTVSCLVCHGEGKVADLEITHDLIRFRELPVDPNE